MTDSPLPGPDWSIGPKGMPWREAARVLLFDPQGRVLLVKAHDPDEPARTWWFTIGGGIDAGESSRQAAVREVFEETGITLAEEDLLGPVASRSATFDFAARHVHQDEVFFLARIGPSHEAVSTGGWTETEQALLDSIDWFSAEEIDAFDVEVFPPQLPSMVATLRSGWDGQLHTLPDQWN